jgi:hypothetical protein
MKSITLSALALSFALSDFRRADAQIRTTPAGKLFFEGDIVRHALMGQQGPFCVLNNRYIRGEAVAWRIRIQKPDGTVADDTALKSVEVELGNGQKLPAPFRRSRHAADGFLLVAVLDHPERFPDGHAGLQGQRHHE